MSRPSAAVKDRVERLRLEILEHQRRYYVLNDPTVSDAEYDALERELRELEAAHPTLITPDSPTQRVGGEPASGFDSYRHERPMLSLDNAYGAEDLLEWKRRLIRAIGEERIPSFLCEPKVDGLSIAVHYEDGRLVRGVTRGDGTFGEVVTPNVRTIRSIPLRLLDAPAGKVEVRGEVFLARSVFAQLNREREQRGESLFANPRNAASGALRMIDARETSERRLDCFFYAIAEVADRLGMDYFGMDLGYVGSDNPLIFFEANASMRLIPRNIRSSRESSSDIQDKMTPIVIRIFETLKRNISDPMAWRENA